MFGLTFPTRLSRAALLLTVLALGCADGDPCFVSGGPCNILEEGCREQIFAQTACVRGDAELDPPIVRTFDREQLRDYLQGDGPEGGEASVPSATYWDRALQLLKFLPEDRSLMEASVDSATEFIAAFYNTRSKEIVIIDGGGEVDELDDSFVLAHEFVHALQDRAEGIAAQEMRWVWDTDSSMAFDSLIEGEAVMVSNLAVARMLGSDGTDVGWDEYYDDMVELAYQEIAASPAPFLAGMQTLVYPVGSRFVTDIYLERGMGGVRGLYDRLPPSFVDWQNGYRGDVQTLFEEVDCLPPPPPQGYEVVELDSLGPVGVSSLWTTQVDAPDRSSHWVRSNTELSNDLRGDRIFVYAPKDDGEGPLAIGWRTRWADAAGAERFVRDAGGHTAVEGNEGLLVLSEDPQLLTDWDELGGCGSYPEPKGTPDPMGMAALRRPHAHLLR